MENDATLVELLERAEQYGKTSVELFKLKAIEKTADVASSFVSNFIVLILIGMSVFIASMGISIWIGEILGHSYAGFFIVAGCYVLIGLLVAIFKRKLVKIPVSNAIITQTL